MRQDNLRIAVSGGAGFECLQVKRLDSIRTARPVQSPMISPHETRTFSLSTAGGGRGRRDCRRGVALQQFIDQPHTPHGASAFPSYSPSGGMDKPTQTKARLADRNVYLFFSSPRARDNCKTTMRLLGFCLLDEFRQPVLERRLAYSNSLPSMSTIIENN